MNRPFTKAAGLALAPRPTRCNRVTEDKLPSMGLNRLFCKMGTMTEPGI